MRSTARRRAPLRSARLIETICGCKWSFTVYHLLSLGINRPGEMVRHVEGLSTKVLNACLRRNIAFGIIARRAYPEVPPRVEYALTPFGEKFVRLLEELEKLQDEIAPELFTGTDGDAQGS